MYFITRAAAVNKKQAGVLYINRVPDRVLSVFVLEYM